MQETQEMQVQSLGWEDPLEDEMATHSSILAWKIPWMEEPRRLQSMGSQRVRYDWATKHSTAHAQNKKPNIIMRIILGFVMKKIQNLLHAHSGRNVCVCPTSLLWNQSWILNLWLTPPFFSCRGHWGSEATKMHWEHILKGTELSD